ncbi:hypothetical protein BKA70DRAFT_1279045 [Coprinopsis sp. MPI-PUGE-AT-0042]|nr:hypothetical protein BKA70DRAFT_1279045 [Coprinopsis sp. MPI-PUGE-AT-0042]
MASIVEIDAQIFAYTRNNDPLPEKHKPILDKELEDVRSRIDACDVPIGRIEDEILDLRRRIGLLEGEVSTLQEELGRHTETKTRHTTMLQSLTGTVSAVRRLPAEIIAAIFTFSLWDGPSLFRPFRLMRLCKVSQMWRNTALSTPSFWRFFPFELDRFSRGRCHEPAKTLFITTLNTWLARGGNGGPISLEFHHDMPELGTSASLQARDVIDWIQTSNFNFVSLKFDDIFSSPAELHNLFSSNASSLASTKDLDLALPTYRTQPPLDFGQALRLNILNVGSTLPKLERLTLTGGYYREPSLEFAHPSVTKLELMNMDLTPVDVPRMIRGLPALQSMSITGCGLMGDDDYGHFEEERYFVHRFIRSIRISSCVSGELFKKFTCPALKRLTLGQSSVSAPSYHRYGTDAAGAKALAQFIHRSQAAAVTLHLEGLFPSTFINTLLSTSSPKVRELYLQTPSCLPLDRRDGALQLAIPRSLESIQCTGPMLEEEATAWVSKLSECLQQPSSQTLSVQFGQGGNAYTRYIN